MAVDILSKGVNLTCITDIAMGRKRRVLVFEVVATMERRGDKARKGLGATGGTFCFLFKLAREKNIKRTMCSLDVEVLASEASLFSLHVATQAFQSRVAIQAR